MALSLLGIALYMFKSLGTIRDEYLEPSLEVIVEKLNISEDVAGATIFSASSSGSKLVACVVATSMMSNELGVGVVVGSAVFDMLMIVGIVAFVGSTEQGTLPIWWYPMIRDAVFYVVAIAELFVVLLDSQVKWFEGLIMVCTFVLYWIYMKLNSRIIVSLGLVGEEDITDDTPTREIVISVDGPEITIREEDEEPTAGADVTLERTMEVPGAKMLEDGTVGMGSTGGTMRSAGGFSAKDSTIASTISDGPSLVRDPLTLFWECVMPDADNHCWLLCLFSTVSIVLCSYLMVDATNRLGCVMRVPSVVMGLLFLAVGTSIPTAVETVEVTKRGDGGLAVANIFTSSILDTLLGLGVPWTIRAAAGKKVEFQETLDGLLWDTVVLLGVLVAVVATLLCKRWSLTRRMGMVLMGAYCVYFLCNLVVGLAVRERGAYEEAY